MTTTIAKIAQAKPTKTIGELIAQPQELQKLLTEQGVSAKSYVASLKIKRAKVLKEIEAVTVTGKAAFEAAYDAYSDWHNCEATDKPNVHVLRKDGKIVRIGNLWMTFVKAKQAEEKAEVELLSKNRYVRNLNKRIENIEAQIAIGTLR